MNASMEIYLDNIVKVWRTYWKVCFKKMKWSVLTSNKSSKHLSFKIKLMKFWSNNILLTNFHIHYFITSRHSKCFRMSRLSNHRNRNKWPWMIAKHYSIRPWLIITWSITYRNTDKTPFSLRNYIWLTSRISNLSPKYLHLALNQKQVYLPCPNWNQ